MSIRSLITKAGALAVVAAAGPMTPLAAQNAAADFKADNAFVSQVAALNLLEVRVGQAAQVKAQTPRVKQFADKVVKDHTDMQQLWMATARKNGASFNARFSPEQQAELNRLNGLTGRDFEVAYMDLMVQDHQTALTTFQTQGRSARSAEVRELVERAIPMLTEHSRLAIQIRGELGGAAVAANQPDTQAAAGAPSPWENVKKDQPRAQPQPEANQNANQNANQQANAARANANVTKADAQFIRDVSAHHFLEERLAELAVRKAQNQQVKEYGQKVGKDHADMEKRWIAGATDVGLTLSPGMGKEHREKLTKLEKKSGRSFDREYMGMEVSNHKGYLNALMREGRAVKSPEVRELVDRAIPEETEHFNLAKQIGARVGADTSAKLRTTSLR